jgi:hypothetical protein
MSSVRSARSYTSQSSGSWRGPTFTEFAQRLAKRALVLELRQLAHRSIETGDAAERSRRRAIRRALKRPRRKAVEAMARRLRHHP